MSNHIRQSHTDIIKRIALDLGFMSCGISNAEFLEEEAPRLTAWLKNGLHGKMSYMENHFDKRLDPTKLVPGSKSVVSLLYNYSTENLQPKDAPKIAKYAYGEDYHFVVKDKLKEFFERINTNIGEVGGRVFVDSAPVLEKSWASKSGLGWVGKNTNLINPKKGSFFFLAELILDIPLIPDGPMRDFCGTCTKCIDACPTDALAPYSIDASKCISYLTIELKDEVIPNQFKDKMEDWIFGCDICQDVCPWNRFSLKHGEPRFEPHEKLKGMDGRGWTELTREVFNEIFKKSAVKRTKFKGLQRNIAFISAKGEK